MRIAETLALSDADRRVLFYSELLKDAGCTAYTSQLAALWLVDELTAKRDLQYLRDRIGGREAAERLARERKGKAFDPEVVDAFLATARDDSFWAELDDEWLWDRVVALEPQGSPYEQIPASRVTEVAFAFADYADMKAPHLAGHSRRVAELAERIGRRLNLAADRLAGLFRAGLVYDVGLVAVPSFVLAKANQRMTEIEREQYRIHPYHSQRILARVPAFTALMPAVAAHHERLDARGYPSGVGAEQINLDARILAVADRFDVLVHDTPEGIAIEVAQAAETLRGEAGMALLQPWAPPRACAHRCRGHPGTPTRCLNSSKQPAEPRASSCHDLRVAR